MALLQDDTAVIREIYANYAGKVKRYITANNGTEEDASDLFQEVLVEIYRQARDKGLQLTCPFEPYLILLCKRKWLNILKKRGRQPVTKDLEDVSIGEDVFKLAEQTLQQEQRLAVFRQCFERLNAGCREVIQKSMTGAHQEEIASQLKVSYGYLRKKKSECMAALAKMIHSQLSEKEK